MHRTCHPWLLLALALPAVTRADHVDVPPETDEIVVTATRTAQDITDLSANVTVLRPRDLDLSAAHRLDDLLRQVPGFSLLRQSSSVVSSNTIQGVSLRGIGPTAAGRTLVLLDGVPLNDPFGGHVAWSRVPLGSVERIEVVRGGGSGVWGSLAMGGVIHILTKEPARRTLRFRGQGGGRSTRDVEVFASDGTDRLIVSLGGGFYDTDGYHTWHPDIRGPIDRRSAVRHGTALGRVDYEISPSARLRVESSYAEEEREKGTPLGRSQLISRFASAGLDILTPDDQRWSVHLFGTSRSARNLSTSVASDRMSERLSRNIHRSPSLALGANAQWTARLSRRHELSIGADHQWIDGESYEHDDYDRTEGRFTSERRVSGKQQLAGAFVQDVFRPAPTWQLVLALRVDWVRNFDALETIVELPSEAVTTNTAYENETTVTPSPSIGVVHHVSSRVSLRAAAYRAFRAATISELYRGFVGRGGVINVGNAALDPERLVGGEGGVDVRLSRRFFARATGFWNEVENTITQRTIGRAPEDEDAVIEPCGQVPAGGVCRQRDNVGRLRSRGVELEATFRPGPSWSFAGSYVFDDAILTDSDDPALIGNQVRHVAEHQLVLRAAFDRPALVSASLQGRYVGERFEDDANELEIGAFVVVDAFVSRRVTPGSEVFVSVENIFDEPFEVRRTGSGLVEIGAPRVVQAGLRLTL